MSIWGSLFTSVSGLSTSGQALEVIGNNIANLNTPGFKLGRAEFSDVLSKQLGPGLEVGRGTRLNAISTLFSEGSYISTESPTDVALEGPGFFMIGRGDLYQYTRAGNFHFDKDGYLVAADGFKVQGFALDSSGEVSGVPTDVQVSDQPLSPQLTSQVTIHANLDATATANPGGASFDINDPTNTSNFSTSITVYDSLGNAHSVTVYFRKTADLTWEYHVVVGASDATGGAAYEATAGTLVFDTQGRLNTHTVTTPADFDFAGGAAQNQSISFVFGDPIADGGTGLQGTTQFGSESVVHYQGQDGYASAELVDVEIDELGRIIGKYDNGEIKYFYRLAVVNFKNPLALSHEGSNLFAETPESGNPIIGLPQEGGNGRLFSGTLEMSNVDLSEEFVRMILTQRGFQANARAITTGDEMTVELVNLKR